MIRTRAAIVLILGALAMGLQALRLAYGDERLLSLVLTG